MFVVYNSTLLQEEEKVILQKRLQIIFFDMPKQTFQIFVKLLNIII